jgi:hypothetical protein
MSISDQEQYDQVYRQLLSKMGRDELGDDPLRQEKMLQKIQRFLDTYPSTIPADAKPNTPIYKLSLQELYRRCLRTAVDILREISGIVSTRQLMSQSALRRSLFRVFTKPERRLYVGVWLIVLSFVLYFIDSAA